MARPPSIAGTTLDRVGCDLERGAAGPGNAVGEREAMETPRMDGATEADPLDASGAVEVASGARSKRTVTSSRLSSRTDVDRTTGGRAIAPVPSSLAAAMMIDSAGTASVTVRRGGTTGRTEA